jgi:hypothetical protein
MTRTSPPGAALLTIVLAARVVSDLAAASGNPWT